MLTYDQWRKMERVSNKQLRPAIYLPEIDCELSIQREEEREEENYMVEARGHYSALPPLFLSYLSKEGKGLVPPSIVNLLFLNMEIDIA